MKIGIQARELSGKGGTKVYIENLLRELIKQNKDHELYIFHQEEKTNLPTSENVQEVKYRGVYSIIDDHIIGHYLMKKHDIDIAFFPKNVVPYFYSDKSIVTVHDLGFFIDSNFYSLTNRVYQKLMINKSCERADKIIAISKNTKKDIMRYTDTSEEKIKVIHHGIDPIFKEELNKGEIQEFKADNDLKKRLIYGGNLGKRKNTETLIKAFNKLELSQYQLVFTGRNPNSETRKLSEKNRDIKLLSYLEREELPTLYSSSDLFIYPSLYEGFGIPPLEAMACGTPVITSNTSSLPEVVGDAGIMVDPHDVDALAEEMERVLESDTLQKNMKRKGLKRVKKFSWEKAAKQVIETYQEVKRK